MKINLIIIEIKENDRGLLLLVIPYINNLLVGMCIRGIIIFFNK